MTTVTGQVSLGNTPSAPLGNKLWTRMVTIASILVVLFTLDRVSVLLAHYWLVESLDLASVFWTNFRVGSFLYITAVITFALAAWIPAIWHSPTGFWRSWIIAPGFLLATIAAYFLSLHYGDFLLGAKGISFNEVDPVFGKDFGFYVFDLPYIWIVWEFTLYATLLFLASSISCAYAARDSSVTSDLNRLTVLLGQISTPVSRAALLLVGITGAVGIWLERYQILTWDNSKSSVHVGAEFVDVTGVLSNLNYITVTTIAILGATVTLWLLAGRLANSLQGKGGPGWGLAGWMLLGFLVLDFGFKGAVELRNIIAVEPNEPVVQLDYIERHIQATRKAYGMEDIEEIPYLPNDATAPLPSAEELLASPTLKNAPLWPGFSAYLERLLDPQHADRILKTKGDSMIYGPTLEIFQQQQKLRTYYKSRDVDTVRYEVDGEKRMFVSSVRELPLYEPVPWLNYWGQRYMLFTHGFGLAMAPVSEITEEGAPNFASYNIPAETSYPELAVTNERIYYGEGSETMAFSNVKQVKELDYPTEQDRAQMFLSHGIDAGVNMDSALKRLVFGWNGARLVEFLFSDLITPETRVHYLRTPLERIEQVAPFLYLDTNPYAIVSDGEPIWMINAMTVSDRYPYSRYGELGDKSDERAVFPRPNQWVNYVEDSVKATVGASTGKLRLYKMVDAPIINTWAAIYPELFVEDIDMPESVRKQTTYPMHLFHVQFDDLFIYYHMVDPMYFFNLEDMWDDGDEVLGPVMGSGKAITFSIEPYSVLVPTGGDLPESEQSIQYALTMAFTPEKALNLRAIPVVYQDYPDYGKKAVLQVPKGIYVMGPEQADAIIDQDPEISQQLSWWNRMGMEVIRGHTSLLLVGKEVLYVEPIFLRSKQNAVSQLKKVNVVFRDKVAMGDNLEDAVRKVIAMHEGAVVEVKGTVVEVKTKPENVSDPEKSDAVPATKATPATKAAPATENDDVDEDGAPAEQGKA